MIGGWDSNGKSRNLVDRMNLRSGHISSISPMAYPRHGASAVAEGDSIFIFGGYNNEENKVLSSCEEYNSITDR